MRFSKSELKDFKTSISREYLITNGIGGYCDSTICGANIRKYSGLLVASLNPPVDRRVLLSKLDETVYIGDKSYILYSNERINKDIDKGFLNQESFEQDYFPTLNFLVDDVFISKKITMVYGKNTTVIKYTIRNNNKPFKIKLDVLINNRDHHDNTKVGDFTCEQFSFNEGTSIKYNKDSKDNLMLYLKSDKACYILEEQWYDNMFYENEHERSLYDTDAHFKVGYFQLELEPYQNIEFSIIASTEEINNTDGEEYFKVEATRKDSLIEKLKYKDDITKKLVLACDTFIVKRKSTSKATVIAGYPWFTDWGRDTMIALPGLTLSTGRYEDAKEMLLTFEKYVKDGLVPNMFPDNGVKPIYNTIDASLWYFNAVYKYLEYTGDYDFIRDDIFPVLTSILDNHIYGTKFEIGMDEKDGLLKGGTKDTQLTWMDVKIKGWAVTPRQGKAVEINALWYNAICIYKELCKKYKKDYGFYDKLAEKIKENFLLKFWNEKTKYFYDYIDGEYYNEQIRPNGIIALSLPFTMVTEEIAKEVLTVAFEKLYTPYGLRSLSIDDSDFIGIYIGNLLKRDSAYHQGTVWSWLIGPFITAVSRWYKDKELCKKIVDDFYVHMREGCVGNISEIFDGNSPHTGRGCFAQAFGASELLRSYLEDVVEN